MKTYLVALDNSSRAPHVLAAASALAQETDARLILFRAVGLPNDLPREAYAMSPDGVIDVLIQRATSELSDQARAVPPAVPVETRVEVGTAWQAICEAGKQAAASLIVIGSHGYAGLDRLLGTTAAKVVNHADRSVFVVRDDPHASAERRSR
ncbi:MAG TPA: universal stress protein [Polyangiaceae bacterium]